MSKPLEDMSYGELQAELRAATEQMQAAHYQEQLNAWRSADEAARERLNAVNREIDRRLALLDTRGAQNGGE